MKKLFFNFCHFLGLPFVFLAFGISVLNLRSKAKRYQRNGEAYHAVDRYRAIYKIMKRLLYIRHIKVISKGFEKIPHKPVLYVLNHKSQIDPTVLIKCLFEQEGLTYFSIVSKIENNRSKYVKAAMDLIDTISVERENIRSVYEAYEEQIKAIKAGRSVVIFGEGTRIFQHEIGEMKPAIIKVAQKTYIPIVPIVIYGSSGLLDSNKQYKNKDKKIYIEVLDILNHNDYIMMKEEYAIKQVRDEIANRYMQMNKLHLEKKDIFPKE